MSPSAPVPTTPAPQGRGQVVARVEQFSGPLPPPELLERYEQLIPGAAARLLAMAEQQAAHRQAIERVVITTRAKREGRGQWIAAGLALVVLLGAMGLIAIGKNLEGLVAVLAEIAALAGVFVYGRRRQEKELEARRRELGVGP